MDGKLIKGNLQKIENQILTHCKAVGRDPSDIQILAVGKRQLPETLNEAFDLGIRHFGENYVQEFLEKKMALRDKAITWHFIGHLQSNKVKDVVGSVELIHSVDSLKVLEKIESVCLKKSCRQKILLELNLAQEETKSGFFVNELEEVLNKISTLSALIPCGLMVMPPVEADIENTRKYFMQARELLFDIKQHCDWQTFNELSMGTSHDYTIAVEEGATIIRLGTALLGQRTV